MGTELLSKISSDCDETPEFICSLVIATDLIDDVHKEFLNRYHNEFHCNSYEDCDIITY